MVDEKRIPYVYDLYVFLASPTTPPFGHPSSDGGGELNPTEWYMQLLAPLSPDIKLDLICKLAESLKEKLPHSEKVTSKSEDFFETLSGAWEEDITNDKSGIEKAMEDVKAGRVDKAKDADELFKQILD